MLFGLKNNSISCLEVIAKKLPVTTKRQYDARVQARGHCPLGVTWVLCLIRRLNRGAADPLQSAPAGARGIDDASSAAAASRLIGDHALLQADVFIPTRCGPPSSR
jgi:hypothetical protein